MKLLGNRLLVSPLPTQEKTESGIFLPQAQAGDKRLWWRIEQVGTHQPKRDGKLRAHGTSASDYRVGQVVLLNNNYTNTTLEDTDRKIVETQYIEAVLE